MPILEAYHSTRDSRPNPRPPAQRIRIGVNSLLRTSTSLPTLNRTMPFGNDTHMTEGLLDGWAMYSLGRIDVIDRILFLLDPLVL